MGMGRRPLWGLTGEEGGCCEADEELGPPSLLPPPCRAVIERTVSGDSLSGSFTATGNAPRPGPMRGGGAGGGGGTPRGSSDFMMTVLSRRLGSSNGSGGPPPASPGLPALASSSQLLPAGTRGSPGSFSAPPGGVDPLALTPAASAGGPLQANPRAGGEWR